MFDNFDETLKKIKKNETGKSFFSGPKEKEIINKAEQAVGFEFSPMYKKFISEFGAGNYGSKEFLGVIDENFDNSCVPDGIWYTLDERKKSNLPKHFLVIYDNGDGSLSCQNYKNIQNLEPEIVLFFPGYSNHEQTYEVVASNFGIFFIDHLNAEDF